MRITLIYDNEVYKEGLEADWGFSCLVEAENKKILFDTGASGRILLSNMEKLKIEPSSIDEVFISHPHFDHTGGLSDFLDKNRNVKIYVPSSFKENLNAKEVIYVKEKIKLHEHIFSTGELEGIEQSLCVKTEKGIVVIVGCSHPKLENILKVASQFGKVYALIGGLHGFKDFDLLNDLKLVCPCHCTQHKSEIKSLYSEKYVEGGAGKIIEI
ncbi:MAG TPA: MBL fold metallo-hydrolase [Candidatus Aenigmarchaeota archaeon]|nr:MBL fold metallo-hydrolase [Candidatus Aenigmarchaeota archaeon]